MAARKKDTGALVARETFACAVKGVEHIVWAGQVVPSTHPAVKGREKLFDPYDPAKPPRAAA